MTIRAIFLDLDNTLCDTYRADRLAVESLTAELDQLLPGKDTLGAAESFLAAIYRRRDIAAWSDQLSKTKTEGEFREVLLSMSVEEMTGHRLDACTCGSLLESYNRVRLEAFDFFPGAERVLGQLRQGHVLVLITNGVPYSQRPKVERVGISRHVDHVLLGGDLPHEKPHPWIFGEALRLAGCAAHEAIHVGDRLDSDILGANRSGIRCVWVSHGAEHDGGEARPDWTISTFVELPGLLEKINQ